MKTHAEKMRRKNESVAELKDCLSRSRIAILTDYRGEGAGLSVKEITNLRSRLREQKAEYRVVKNTLIRIAARELGIEGLDIELKGPVAIAFGYDEPAAVTKTVIDFARESKDKKLPLIRQGLIEGQVLSAEKLQAIAELPSREQLLQQLLGLMLAPHRGLMGVINGPGRALATVVDAWRKKQEEGAA
ncbi:MAG: 50S ribosomal protein L10 [Armatimonadetes bacterium]|nr:50S ribosomal protein L10 [Armatimonadota bacterium]